jgi:ATP-dependent 26S proteasome regulatory subunit
MGIPNNIQDIILKEIRPARLSSYHVATRAFPAFRFVDVYNAVEAISSEAHECAVVKSMHGEDLSSIIHTPGVQWSRREYTRSTLAFWPAGPTSEISLPIDQFWLFRPPEEDHVAVVRVRYIEYQDKVMLEAATVRSSTGEILLDRVGTKSLQESIYRNQTIELAYQAGTRDQYGEVEQMERVRVLFKQMDPVEDKDVILDDTIRRMLLRNVVDLHERRELLKAHHVPIRRGVLLYGPPGTGKTYTCRYLCTKLPTATKIIATGSAMMLVSKIFQLARLFQPAVIFLEDIDLVFTHRDINYAGAMLGELLDQMDGLRSFEDIGFVMTTNAIDRLESALKDRPGRISQCIFLGPPNPALRRRFLQHALQPYDSSHLEIDRLVSVSEGATQAFVKEWVHRAVQIATTRLADREDALQLQHHDFTEALDEMRQFGEGTAGTIVGFRSGR